MADHRILLVEGSDDRHVLGAICETRHIDLPAEIRLHGGTSGLLPAITRVARDEMARIGVNVPLWVSDRETLERAGPLGQAWRNPDTWDPTYAFE